MKRTIQTVIRVIVFFAILGLILVGGLRLRQFGREHFQMIWAVLWSFFTPLLMAAFLLHDHIRAWFDKGKLRIDTAYLTITIIFLLLFLPWTRNLPMIRVVSHYVWSSSYFQMTVLVFWFYLIKAFRKDTE